jgi:hypothetical protein
MAQSILRDAETEALFRDMSRPLIEAAGFVPENVEVVLDRRQDDQRVRRGRPDRLHPLGLIAAADNANEVQGVIAHELGHITGGHIIRFGEGAKVATGIMLLSLLLGAAAVAAGAGKLAPDHGSGRTRRNGQVPRVQPHAGIERRLRGRQISERRRGSAPGLAELLQEAPEPGIPLRGASEDSYARTHPLSASAWPR